MVPTEFARGIETPLRIFLDDVETRLKINMQFDPSTATDVFKIVESDFYHELLMPQAAARLAARAPGMTVQVLDLVRDSHFASVKSYAVRRCPWIR